MPTNNSGGLGRRLPTTLDHVDRHPLQLHAHGIADTQNVNISLRLPSDLHHYYALYDQGAEGACVGFGSSWCMTILNRRAYAARTLYLETQLVDEWPDTPPEEGTSVHAAMDVLRTRGHWRSVYNRKTHVYEVTGPFMEDGIEANKWTTNVDDVRACLAAGVPVVIGINWYGDFDNPKWDPATHRFVIGRNPQSLGRVRGGHCVCIRAATDKLGMVGGVNNWGAPEIVKGSDGNPTVSNGYPLFWMPYDTLERVLSEDGECTVITDRTGKPQSVAPDQIIRTDDDTDADQGGE
jgi:hypothetical protein